MNANSELLKLRKIKLNWINFLKLILFTCFIWFFSIQITHISLADFGKLKITNPYLLISAVCLMFLNWGLEFLKWRVVVNSLNFPISNQALAKSFFSGIATSIATPNRFGNFIGRVMYMPKSHRIKLVFGTLYANFSQFLSTIYIGIVALFYCFNSVYSNIWIFISIILFLFVGTLIYFVFPYLPIEKMKLFNKRKQIIGFLRRVIRKISLKVFLMSLIRYIIFLLQYVFLLLAFDDLEFSLELLMAISLVFMFSTLLPNFLISKIFVRESLSLVFLGSLVLNPANILASSISLWLLNLALPGLLGLFFVLRCNRISDVY